MKLVLKPWKKMTWKDGLIASPGVYLVLIGGIGLDHAWPYAFWILVAGLMYQPAVMLYLMRKPKAEVLR